MCIYNSLRRVVTALCIKGADPVQEYEMLICKVQERRESANQSRYATFFYRPKTTVVQVERPSLKTPWGRKPGEEND